MKKLLLSIALVVFVASFTAPTVSAAFSTATGFVKQDKEKAKDDKKCAPGCTKPCCKDKKDCSHAKKDSCKKAEAKPEKK
jgi:hypothetical protein